MYITGAKVALPRNLICILAVKFCPLFHIYCTHSLYILYTASHRDKGCVAEKLDLHLGPLASGE